MGEQTSGSRGAGVPVGAGVGLGRTASVKVGAGLRLGVWVTVAIGGGRGVETGAQAARMRVTISGIR